MASSPLGALGAAALGLARSAPSGRLVLARLAEALEPAWLLGPRGEELAVVLAQSRADACEPVPWGEIEAALRGAWGAPLSEVLDELRPEPVAVTPAAQVHRGALGGAPVAVKVLRPGLAAGVRRDLGLLDLLAFPLAVALPGIDVGGLLAEVRARALEEVDLEHEAAVQRRFHRALRDHPRLGVPAVRAGLCTEEVLVSAWADGVPLARAADPDAAAALLVAFACGAGPFGRVLGSLHPSDVLVAADGRLTVLDFGATRAVEPERNALVADAVAALAAADEAAFGAALAALGVLGAEHGPAALELVRHVLGELAEPGPARLDADAVCAVRDRLRERRADGTRLLARLTLPPQDLWPLRGLGELFGTLARVGATGDWIGVAARALRDGWDAAQ